MPKEARGEGWVNWSWSYRPFWVVWCGCRDLNSIPQDRAAMYLIAEPSFQPHISSSLTCLVCVCSWDGIRAPSVSSRALSLNCSCTRAYSDFSTGRNFYCFVFSETRSLFITLAGLVLCVLTLILGLPKCWNYGVEPPSPHHEFLLPRLTLQTRLDL